MLIGLNQITERISENSAQINLQNKFNQPPIQPPTKKSDCIPLEISRILNMQEVPGVLQLTPFFKHTEK
jgi:hypothetical protein